MTQESKSFRDNETGLTEWETRMAKLVGLDESIPADIEGEPISNDVNPQSEDEPTANATVQPLSANPFAKAGLVGAGTLAVVMFAGGFLSQIMSNDSPQVTQNAIRSTTPPAAKAKPRIEQLQEEVEGLKTKLALSEQLETVKAAQQKLRMVKPASKATIAVKPTPSPRARIPRNLSITRIPRPPQPPQVRVVEVPKIVKVERVVNAPQPKPQPQKIAKAAPKPIPVLPQMVPPPEPPALTPQQPLVEIEPPPQPNPMQEWARLAKLGSYGQVSFGENRTVRNQTSPTRIEAPRKVEERATTTNIQRQTPTPIARRSPRRNSKTIPVGSSATAVLATPVYGETTRSSRPSRRRENENEDNNVYVVRLKKSLKAADGTTALAAGSQIFAKVDSISESGLIQLGIVKIMTREKGEVVEKNVPQNALVIRGNKGKPLMAKQYRNNRSSIARRDAVSFLAGGVGKAAEYINRTESEVVTGENGTVAVTNVNRDPSLAAGILEGGTKTVVPQISRRNQRAISQMSRRTNIWYLPEGKKVEVFVNQEVQI
ncbi:Bacterial conjugation TrbI-like protein [Rivularia sp. PCC 7116]|uniref:TrbI/VirB10 family protein n=1 Tax=Rivularia sp. PCC 7116 TaxID=373994 RepID=UPI00029F49CA|nr:TrbI/VirB10 family protein [Rivularia sp. PCC 7116]AFY56364.1 Bacterial conjugation TrbI-like protein [Rivularia sp. PCC 7116]